ncbi:MAG: DUF2478 domain-containing protein [Rhodobacteraceae bacterium]|nr:DUF2478 domain-containing protein [Paracoccaceae bacterium]MCB1396311.1 DUF2478 domain-containing protein [Paracoccaceae bacterium]
MNLAYVICQARGETDRLLSALAARLKLRGVALAGVVQTNTECADSTKCDMDVQVLPDGETIRISQSLGEWSRGCRLDPAALEQAVALVGASLDDGPELLIVNKFGKHEADGRGFRPLIGDALVRGIPVIAGVNGLNEDKFLDFTEGSAERLPGDLGALEAWFDRTRAQDVSDVA